MWHSHLNVWKFLKQKVVFPEGLNWVQHWVSRIGLLVARSAFHIPPAYSNFGPSNSLREQSTYRYSATGFPREITSEKRRNSSTDDAHYGDMGNFCARFLVRRHFSGFPAGGVAKCRLLSQADSTFDISWTHTHPWMISIALRKTITLSYCLISRSLEVLSKSQKADFSTKLFTNDIC